MSTDTYNQLKPHNPNLSSSIVFFERMKQMPSVESETKYDIIKRLYAHVTHHADAVLYILLIYNVSLATENMYMYRTYLTCIRYLCITHVSHNRCNDTKPRNNLLSRK